jgi:F420-non-reducing hydrogenase iron-sulfur subunit
MSKVKTRQKVILFTCNWHAYSSMEAAGRERSSYSTAVVPIRLSCLGRISPGIILKAFEGGAAGVLLLGCPEGQCHFETGNLEALNVIEETRSLLKLLGYDKNRLEYQLLPADQGETYLEVVNQFLDRVENGRKKT